MDGCTILAEVKRSSTEVILFGSDEYVYRVVCDPKGYWHWHAVNRYGPWNVNAYRSYHSARRHLARWLGRHTMLIVDHATGEGVWSAPDDRYVDYP